TGLGAASSRASTPIRLAERMARLAPAVILALVFARYSIAASSRNLANNRQSGEGPYALNSLEMFEAIETYTAPTSTVVFFKPRVMRLYTQRPSVLIDDPEFLPQEGYICIHRTFGPYFQLDTDELAALVGSGRLHPIYENANFTLYQLNSRPKGAPPALNGGTTSPRR
ncbi:MAG: hypothetical protein O2923_14495, partial [Verrucomicrobia bacterium]|nr:hypothetical protein [Verrucomicrobiota bacterium]